MNTLSSSKGWAIPLILVVTFLVLLTIGIYFYRKYKREQVRRNLEYYENQRTREVDRRLYGDQGERTEWLNQDNRE